MRLGCFKNYEIEMVSTLLNHFISTDKRWDLIRSKWNNPTSINKRESLVSFTMNELKMIDRLILDYVVPYNFREYLKWKKIRTRIFYKIIEENKIFDEVKMRIEKLNFTKECYERAIDRVLEHIVPEPSNEEELNKLLEMKKKPVTIKEVEPFIDILRDTSLSETKRHFIELGMGIVILHLIDKEEE